MQTLSNAARSQRPADRRALSVTKLPMQIATGLVILSLFGLLFEKLTRSLDDPLLGFCMSLLVAVMVFPIFARRPAGRFTR